MSPNSSDLHLGRFVTLVSRAELENEVAVEDMSHGPLGFLNGTFRGAQLQWAKVNKKGYAIVNTFRRLEYFSLSGVIFTDLRNLAYISDPEACMTTLAKTAAQRLEQ